MLAVLPIHTILKNFSRFIKISKNLHLQRNNFCSFLVEGDATGWTEHKTRDGYTCYYDNQTGEYSWEYPEGWTGVSSDLSREEIQVKEEEREREGSTV